MWVEGPADVRGVPTYVLRFDSRVRVALFTGISRSESWFDPQRKTSLRYFKQERNVLTHEDVAVDIYPEQKRWESKERHEPYLFIVGRAVVHVLYPHATAHARHESSLRSALRCGAQSRLDQHRAS
jgi:hypothetical protein